ncbi:MAG TPA: plastocyanin/azurin family copper-binding protein, partial [Vicinamibacterales bacterium]|nr:plastocyanin/azurin family copper-binding protein [Vicinamibacterales bacterium]
GVKVQISRRCGSRVSTQLPLDLRKSLYVIPTPYLVSHGTWLSACSSTFMMRLISFGSLMAVLALGAGCGSSSTSPSGSASPQGPGIDFTININGDRGSASYAPSPLTMRVGQVVNWHNLDSIEHTATLEGMFDSGRIPAGSAHDNAVTMSRAGTFTYHCTIHPGMVGTIVVQ